MRLIGLAVVLTLGLSLAPGKVSIQRSPPRWVAAEYGGTAERFIHSLV
jgi:hypothetical protein